MLVYTKVQARASFCARLDSVSRFKAANSLYRTSPQDAVVPLTVIEGPAAWIGSEIQQTPQQYIYHVTESNIEELEAAVAAVQEAGVHNAEQVRRAECRFRSRPQTQAEWLLSVCNCQSALVYIVQVLTFLLSVCAGSLPRAY